MSDKDYDIVVVGAGPAGLAAAKRAAEAGATVALLDDNPKPGGQIWRSDPAQWKPLLGKLEPLCGVRVFAVPEPGRLGVEKFDGDFEIGYRKLILATGARERFLPFPGWTLPNVMGAGGLQALVKSGLPIEGKRVIIAGSGPLLLAVAKYMRGHGAQISLLAEQAGDASLFRFSLGLIGYPGKLFQTMQFASSLLGIRHRTSCWPIAAEGSGKLESVTLYRAGKTWKEPCDYLACGFGLVPNVELPLMLGCRLSATGVFVDENQQTSVPGVYCAGEVTGIGGLDLSLVEGGIAGYSAAGKPDAAAALFAARDRHRRFANALEKAFALRDELKSLPSDDTLICRCEDVAYGRVRQCSGWRDAKLHTRCGMGPCQGRVCGGAVEFLLGWKSESVRPPVFPARIGSLSGPKYPQP
jgi:NADPH-dependent 2,4-dienoyl-CoA reductase/sulfur reductase-like enzyme